MDKTKRRGFSILIAALFLICIALLIAFFFPRGDTRQDEPAGVLTFQAEF